MRLCVGARFEGFAAGANAEVLAALRSPGAGPLWLWGGDGVGKTHLLQAVCAAADTANGRAAATPRTAFGLPTVEELDTLLARIRAVEGEVSATLQQQVNADIARLKRQIGDLEGDEFERAFHELDRALATRKALAGQVREEAFKRVEADLAFAPRKFLRLISREPKG